MSNRSYSFRLLRAVWLWLFGTWAGRAKGLAALAFAAGVVSLAYPRGQTELKGTWKGLANQIAPDKGTLTIEGTPGASATCVVRGKAGFVTGNGWNFKGEATVAEKSCAGRIEKGGSVSLALELRLEWSGRIKGIGGDWEDIDGFGDCEGQLEGKLTAGGRWEGKCKNDKHEWDAAIDWEPEAGSSSSPLR